MTTHESKNLKVRQNKTVTQLAIRQAHENEALRSELFGERQNKLFFQMITAALTLVLGVMIVVISFN